MQFIYDLAGDVRRAVLHAAQAANLIGESFPQATHLTFSLMEMPAQLLRLYDATGAVLWSHDGENSGTLAHQEQIGALLEHAEATLDGCCWSKDPDFRRELCELDIPEMLNEESDLVAQWHNGNVNEQASQRGVTRTLTFPEPRGVLLHDARVDETEAVLERAARQHAAALKAQVAKLIRRLLPEADTVVFEADVYDNGDTRIDLMSIFDSQQRMLWFEDGCGFPKSPEAVALAERVAYGDTQYVEFDWEAQQPIEGLLREAYDAWPAQFDTADEPAGGGSVGPHNLLALVVPDGLESERVGALAAYLALDDKGREDARTRAAENAERAGREAAVLYAAEIAKMVTAKCPKATSVTFNTYPSSGGPGLAASVTAISDDSGVLWSEDDMDADSSDDSHWTDEELAEYAALADLVDDSTVSDRIAQLAALDDQFNGTDVELEFADYLS